MSAIKIYNDFSELEKNDSYRFNENINELWKLLEKKEFNFSQIESENDLYSYKYWDELEYSLHDSIELNSNFTILNCSKNMIKLLVYPILPPIENIDDKDIKWNLSIEQFYELICNIENNIIFEETSVEKKNILLKKDFYEIKKLLKEIIEYRELEKQKRIWLWKKFINMFKDLYSKVTRKILGND